MCSIRLVKNTYTVDILYRLYTFKIIWPFCQFFGTCYAVLIWQVLLCLFVNSNKKMLVYQIDKKVFSSKKQRNGSNTTKEFVFNSVDISYYVLTNV